MVTPIEFVQSFFMYSKRATDLDPLSKLVLIAISFLVDPDTGSSEISLSSLIKQTSCSDKTIRSHIKKLENLKIIRVLRRHNLPSIITIVGYVSFTEWNIKHLINEQRNNSIRSYS